MDELADLEHAHARSGVAPRQDDPEAVVGDDPAARDLAGQRVRRVGGCLLCLGERKLAERCGLRRLRRRRQVALGRRAVADPLMRTLLVVVRSEAVEQQLQVLEVCRRPLVREPLLERAVEALELAECLRVGGGGVDQLDPDLGELALERRTGGR